MYVYIHICMYMCIYIYISWAPVAGTVLRFVADCCLVGLVYDSELIKHSSPKSETKNLREV